MTIKPKLPPRACARVGCVRGPPREAVAAEKRFIRPPPKPESQNTASQTVSLSKPWLLTKGVPAMYKWSHGSIVSHYNAAIPEIMMDSKTIRDYRWNVVAVKILRDSCAQTLRRSLGIRSVKDLYREFGLDMKDPITGVQFANGDMRGMIEKYRPIPPVLPAEQGLELDVELDGSKPLKMRSPPDWSRGLTLQQIMSRRFEEAKPETKRDRRAVKSKGSQVPVRSGRKDYSTDALSSTSTSTRTSTTTTMPQEEGVAANDAVYPVLLPGYAHASSNSGGVSGSHDELHVTLRGFVARRPATQGRGQRMFNLMARQLARLPKPLSASSTSLLLNNNRTSTDDGVFFPDRPRQPQPGDAEHTPLTERIAEEITDHVDEEVLGKLVEKVGALPIDGQRGGEEASASHSTHVSAQPAPSRLSRLKAKGLALSRSASTPSLQSANSQLVGGSQFWLNRSLDEIHQLTHNLNERLADFWIFRVAFQRVRIDIQGLLAKDDWTTLLAQEMQTDANGMFRLKVNLGSLDVVAGSMTALRARAVHLDGTGTHSEWIHLDMPSAAPSQIRLISDVDDTIRKTNVLQGLTSVFRQVFVLAHTEVIVPGMAQWYHRLRSSDVGIHFVSNAPIELWRPIREYLEHAGMPLGHLHLKSYNSEVEGSLSNTSGGGASSSTAKTSLLSTWLQPASARKRAAIVSILDDFPKAQFLLVGDTGELDLELYSELAKERPKQIKALYLRNVSSDRDPLEELKEAHNAADARIAALSLDSAPTPTTSRTAQLRRVLPTRSSTLDSSATPKRPTLLQRHSGLSLQQHLHQATSEELGGSRGEREQMAASATSTSVLPPPTLPSPTAFLSRVLKAKNIIPPATQLHFFKEGGDVMAGSEELVRRLRGGWTEKK